MKLEKEYTLIQDLEVYTPSSKKAKNRIKWFKSFYKNNKKFFGKKILDLACGGGVFSNFLAKKGHKVIGVDILDMMLKIARKHAPKQNPPKYVKANILKFIPKEKFGTAIFMGNTIPHFSPKDFAQLIKNIRKKIKYFIISYRDSIKWGFEGLLKLIIIDEKKGYDVIDLYKGYDGKENKIIKYRIIYPKNEKVVIDYYLYNPGIIEGVMSASGFKLVKRELLGKHSMEEFIDVYQRISEIR